MVAINKFISDTDTEIKALLGLCQEMGVVCTLNECWEKGGEGGIEMANALVQLLEQEESAYHPIYEVEDSIENKINTIVREIYGGTGAVIEAKAQKQIAKINELGLSHLPICMAKTQYSFSDDAKKIGAPTDFTVKISNLKVAAGAGFIVALTGTIMTMPGLPKVPASEKIDIDAQGNITGLF